jgi:hypothetical protein
MEAKGAKYEQDDHDQPHEVDKFMHAINFAG